MKLLSLGLILMSGIASASVTTSRVQDEFPNFGSGDAGGGDAYALEFTLLGHQAAEVVRSANVAGVSAGEFSEHVNSVQVVSEEKLFLSNVEVDAINIPSQKKIMMSRSRWDQLENSLDKKFKLVIHEYLSVMGYEDANYQTTEKIFAAKGDPILDISCSSGRIYYRINLFKNAQPVVIVSREPRTNEKPDRKQIFPALSSGGYNGPGMTRTNRLTVTFLNGPTNNVLIPLHFERNQNGISLVPSTEMQMLASPHQTNDFRHTVAKVECKENIQ